LGGFRKNFKLKLVAILIGDYLVITPSSKGIIESSITCLTKYHSWLTNLTFEILLVFPKFEFKFESKNLRQVLDSKFKLKLEASFYGLDLSSYPTLSTSV
jgi:hypothetical protein